MGRYALARQARSLQDLLQHLVDHLPPQWLPPRVHEQPPVLGGGSVGQVLLDRRHRGHRQGHDPLLSALPVHKQLSVLEIDILQADT